MALVHSPAGYGVLFCWSSCAGVDLLDVRIYFTAIRLVTQHDDVRLMRLLYTQTHDLELRSVRLGGVY